MLPAALLAAQRSGEMPAAVTPGSVVVVAAAAVAVGRRRPSWWPAAAVVALPTSRCCRCRTAASSARATTPATAGSEAAGEVRHGASGIRCRHHGLTASCELCQRSTTRSSAPMSTVAAAPRKASTKIEPHSCRVRLNDCAFLTAYPSPLRHAGEELGEHGADQRQPDGDAGGREQVGEGVGHAQAEEHLPLRRVDRPQQLVGGGVDRAEADDGVEQERHEADEGGADEDRLHAEAEPDHQRRCVGDRAASPARARRAA